MTTKPCEHCAGTGRRKVGPSEAFEDDLRARGIWYRWEGAFSEAPGGRCDAAIVLLHNPSGSAVSVEVGPHLGDREAEAVARAREAIAKIGGWESLARA